MIKIENVEVMGWEAAIRGMRNPMNSWEKSDSVFIDSDGDWYTITGNSDPSNNVTEFSNGGDQVFIGPDDYALMMKLANAGTDHRKFMRMITVYLDITAPLYWFKEFDTYKVGTVANSCSTMHKIHEKEFTIEDFSCDKLISNCGLEVQFTSLENETHLARCGFDDLLRVTVDALNFAREMYIKSKDKKYWWQMIQLLPSSYNQKRTVMLNYEVLANIYKSRKNHKLDEWVEFCKWIESLPYSELITEGTKSKEDMAIIDKLVQVGNVNAISPDESKKAIDRKE